MSPSAPLIKEDSSQPKDSTLCILPGCPRKKYVESNGRVHPYCGRTCAERGKKEGIVGKQCCLVIMPFLFFFDSGDNFSVGWLQFWNKTPVSFG